MPETKKAKGNWPDHPCGFHGCDRTDEEHHVVYIYWNSAGNIAVRAECHLWPTKRDGTWIGHETGRTWSSGGSDRAAYRRARDRARTRSERYGDCDIRDRGVRLHFLDAFAR